jgi:hypothetical protein
MRSAAFSLLLLPAITACGPSLYGFEACHPGRGVTTRADAAVEAAALVATAIVVTANALAHDDVEEPPPAYVPAPPGPPLPRSARDAVVREREEEARFDGLAARAALGRLDLASCRSRGAPHGYGHARVTFAEDGHVARVVIDAPSGLAEEAVACVGARLGEARVAAFTGPAAPVGFQTFVP